MDSMSDLDTALNFCESRIAGHKSLATRNFIVALCGLFGGGVLCFQAIAFNDGTVQTSFAITFVALTVMVFGVFMALHRYHLNEVAKYEHYNLAFSRLNIARSFGGFGDGKDSPIIASLTTDAFNYVSGAASKNKVSSPMPGHPTSDLSAVVLNKLLEKIDFSASKNANK